MKSEIHKSNFNSNPLTTPKLQIRPFKSKYYFKLQDLNSQNPKFTNQINNPIRIQNSTIQIQISLQTSGLELPKSEIHKSYQQSHSNPNSNFEFKFQLAINSNQHSQLNPVLKSNFKTSNSTIHIPISLQDLKLQLPKTSQFQRSTSTTKIQNHLKIRT
jgi:hypothetical protein